MSRLMNDLLWLAKAHSGALALADERVELGALLDGLKVQTYQFIQPTQKLHYENLLNSPAWVHGDSEHLNLLFNNLLVNAARYSAADGEITLRLSQANGEFLVQVEDRGIGIPADDIAHIFDPFYRVDKARTRSAGGTGLGLAIGRWIVE